MALTHLKSDFSAGTPISQVPASWFNAVANFINNLIPGDNIKFEKHLDGNATIIEAEGGGGAGTEYVQNNKIVVGETSDGSTRLTTMSAFANALMSVFKTTTSSGVVSSVDVEIGKVAASSDASIGDVVKVDNNKKLTSGPISTAKVVYDGDDATLDGIIDEDGYIDGDSHVTVGTESDKWVKTTTGGLLTVSSETPAVLTDNTPSGVAYNGSGSVGSSDKAARADHVHALAKISAADVTIGTSDVATELVGLANDIADVDAVATAAASAASDAATAAASASATATNAITAANGAVSASAAAQQTATAAGEQATVAIRDAATAISDAAAAQSTADTALANAATAQSTADTASSTATSAQSTADNANNTANTANSTANTANETANAVSGRVTTIEGYFSSKSSKSPTVLTGVSWNGTQLVFTATKLNFSNGVFTGISSVGNTTIETVTYNPS